MIDVTSDFAPPVVTTDAPLRVSLDRVGEFG
ncbi:hypothetical protein MCELHM10_04176 [Paracoccaceae bacterium]|jgi:hypothetical protein